MTPDNVGPISRPFPLHRVSPEGVDSEVVATASEMAALARDLGLLAIHDLVGRFRITGTAGRVRVTGRLTARIKQTCVVSLDPFETSFKEDVEVAFETPPGGPPSGRAKAGAPNGEIEADLDAPEELVGDRIDLGAILAEFLALGLDPHPRKAGVAFEAGPDENDTPSAFAGLASLRSPERES